MKKSFFTFSLIFMLCFVNVHQVYADAGSLVVAGGSIGTAGLAGSGVGAALAPYVVPIILGVLVAGGLNVYLTEQSQDAGMTKTEYLRNQIANYCDEIGKPIDSFWNGFANNISIAENGAIYLKNIATKQISQFVNWLQTKEKIYSSDALDFNGSYININGLQFPVLHPGNSIALDNSHSLIINNSDKAVAIMKKTEGSFALFCPSDVQVDLDITVTGRYEGLMSLDLFKNGFAYGHSTLVYVTNSIIPTVTAYDEFLESVQMDNPDNDTFTGTQDNVTGLTNVLDTTNNNTTVYQPDIINNIDTTGINDLIITVDDYIETLQDILDNVHNPSITAEDDKTGEKDEYVVDDSVIDPTITKEDDDTLPDQEITDLDDDNKTPVPTDLIDPLEFDLKGFFPFCLPFDVADMIGMLQADPVAPSYTVDWDIPFIEQNLTFTVDLEPYDNVAETCRKMEILLFCVGLAVVTRSIFIRS